MWCQILFWHALLHTHFEDPFVISYYGWLYEIVSCAGTLPQSLWWSLKWLLSEDWKGRSHCLPGEFTIQYRRLKLLLVIIYILIQTANPQIQCRGHKDVDAGNAVHADDVHIYGWKSHIQSVDNVGTFSLQWLVESESC